MTSHKITQGGRVGGKKNETVHNLWWTLKVKNWREMKRETPYAWYLTIGSYVSVRSSRYEARGKFGEHERCVRVARGVAESNSSFSSAL